MSSAKFIAPFIRGSLALLLAAAGMTASPSAGFSYTGDGAAGGMPPVETLATFEGRARAILRAYDPDAIVVVRPAPTRRAKETLQLPGTPFNSGVFSLEGGGGERKTYEMKIWTSRHPIPPELVGIMEEALSGEEAKFTVKSLPLPGGISRPEEPGDGGSDKNASRIVEAIGDLSASLKSIPESLRGAAAEGLGDKLGSLTPLVYGLLALIFALRVAGMLTAARSMRGLGQAIRGALASGQPAQPTQAAGGREEGGGAGREAARPQPGAEEKAGEGAREDLAAMSPEGLAALISDLRWSGRDGAAAWVWAKMTEATRRAVLAHAGGGDTAAYVGALVRLRQEPTDHHRDPYYMAPLPIGHLGNAELAAMVLAEGGERIYAQLPLARREALPIPNMSRLTLAAAQKVQPGENDGVDAGAIRELLASRPPTPPPPVPPTDEVVPADDAEEEALAAAAAAMPWSQARILMSVAHFARIADPAAREMVLTDFPARELAAALVGPDAVVGPVLAALPEGRRGLVASYRTGSARRAGPAHRRLVAAIAAAVDESGTATVSEAGTATVGEAGSGAVGDAGTGRGGGVNS